MGYSDADKYYFTVKNQGDAAAGPFTRQRHERRDIRDSRARAGASATRTFREACQVVTNVATADALGQVAESDETNNTRSFTVDTLRDLRRGFAVRPALEPAEADAEDQRHRDVDRREAAERAVQRCAGVGAS